MALPIAFEVDRDYKASALNFDHVSLGNATESDRRYVVCRKRDGLGAFCSIGAGSFYVVKSRRRWHPAEEGGILRKTTASRGRRRHMVLGKGCREVVIQFKFIDLR